MGEKNDLPIGFVITLGQNETAMKNFESLSEEEKKSLIMKAHSVQSKSEMQSLVNSLGNGTGY